MFILSTDTELKWVFGEHFLFCWIFGLKSFEITTKTFLFTNGKKTSLDNSRLLTNIRMFRTNCFYWKTFTVSNWWKKFLMVHLYLQLWFIWLASCHYPKLNRIYPNRRRSKTRFCFIYRWFSFIYSALIFMFHNLSCKIASIFEFFL